MKMFSTSFGAFVLFFLLSGCGGNVLVENENDTTIINDQSEEQDYIKTARIMYRQYSILPPSQISSNQKSTKSNYPGENTRKPRDSDTYYISDIVYENDMISQMTIQKGTETISIQIDNVQEKVTIVATSNTDRKITELSIENFTNFATIELD